VWVDQATWTLGPGLIIVRITINLSTYAPRYVIGNSLIEHNFLFPWQYYQPAWFFS